jgi:1-deoxy-D-xylulose-5-phosphate synthase
VVAIYSTFLQRAYDQIIHDVAVQRLPVTFALDRGGLVGADGKTHQGAFDLTYLRCVPNMLLMAPSDENEMRHMLATALAYDGPAAFRFPRASGLGVPLDTSPAPFEVGKARLARNGGPRPDLLVLAAGTVVQAALAAGEALALDGFAVSVVDARFVKPLDEELFCSLAVAARCVLTVEEASLVGGFGAGCLEAFERHGVLHQLRVRRLGIPDSFITHGDAAKQRVQLGFDAAGIAAAGRELVGDRAARGVA